MKQRIEALEDMLSKALSLAIENAESIETLRQLVERQKTYIKTLEDHVCEQTNAVNQLESYANSIGSDLYELAAVMGAYKIQNICPNSMN